MNELKNYLLGLRGDIFKLLPMKEAELEGMDNHLSDYVESLLINLTGATKTFPVLVTKKHFMRVLNNIQYIANHQIDFSLWRKIILNSTGTIDHLCYTLEE